MKTAAKFTTCCIAVSWHESEQSSAWVRSPIGEKGSHDAMIIAECLWQAV